MDTSRLDNNPTLDDIQRYNAEMLVTRGFDHETVEQNFMLLMEEVGEFARAARKISGIKFADDTKQSVLADEAADVCMMLLALCNKLDINLTEAVRRKEAKNNQRTWS